ncbi:hypothetical protein PHLGIDRAFT_336009 [Phlebiopsis gigantea 11061_1 CR5-6]|uniref:F-box domain-containing protein n=1 Tax=Phlebiopsis gigantea (strain 11061_1 CR5-6) TaxID=745531 RepID=A0A0C3NB83_PHLG1|nr:hypothetical protein PHLGIDRAFT_336009 [Phlebiopsis gigantea 11061_1 CR5-6]
MRGQSIFPLLLKATVTYHHTSIDFRLPSTMVGLSDLPLSVIHQIRGYIRLRDLLTHVSFQATCRKVRDVYLNDENFWEAACVDAGIAKPIPDTDFPFISAKWRDMAIICANHLYICELPMCDLYQCSAEVYDDYRNQPLNVANGHELENFAGFSTRLHVLTGYHAIDSCYGAPTDTHYLEPDGLGDRRIVHAAGLCKFATAPAVRGIWISIFSFKKWVYNPNGITQWDVAQTVRGQLISRKGSIMLHDLVQAWQIGKEEDICVDLLDDLCWLEGLTASVAVPYLYALTRLQLQDDQANRSRIWRRAIWAFYNVMREQPDALLSDLLCYNITIRKHLSWCSVEDFRQVMQKYLGTLLNTPWAVSIFKYETPLEFVRDRLMFTGIEWVKDRRDIERKPCFRVKWGFMREGEPTEIAWELVH